MFHHSRCDPASSVFAPKCKGVNYAGMAARCDLWDPGWGDPWFPHRAVLLPTPSGMACFVFCFGYGHTSMTHKMSLRSLQVLTEIPLLMLVVGFCFLFFCGFLLVWFVLFCFCGFLFRFFVLFAFSLFCFWVLTGLTVGPCTGCQLAFMAICNKTALHANLHNSVIAAL